MSFVNDIKELSFDDIHFDSLEQDLADLASEGVLPSGVYLGQVNEIKVYTKESDDRQMAQLRTQLFNEEGDKLRRVKINVSWEKRIVNGRVDKAFRMFAALRKALEIESMDPRDILMSAKEGAINVNVSETYYVDESDLHPAHAGTKSNDEGQCWVNLSKGEAAEEQRMHYLSKGYEAISIVQGVFKANQ